MNIRVQIDRINLDGITLTAHERALFQAALESELSTLLLAGNLQGVANSAVPTLRAGDVTWTGNPTALGTQVAQAIYGGMGDGKAG